MRQASGRRRADRAGCGQSGSTAVGADRAKITKVVISVSTLHLLSSPALYRHGRKKEGKDRKKQETGNSMSFSRKEFS